MRTRVCAPIVALALLALPVSAEAVSVVTVTQPPNGKIYYTGDSFTAVVPVSATLSSDCESGTWYIRRNPPGGPYGPYTAGGLLGTNPLTATNYLEPGFYEYSGHVNCVKPEGDTYTTNFPTIQVIAGFPPDVAPPTATLSGKKRQQLGKTVAVKVKCDEACTATGSGTLSIPNASKGYRLEKSSKEVAAGDTATLKLKLSKAARTAAEKALENGRKLEADLKVVAKDASGNKTTETRAVKLKLG